jgi:maleate cis-trans isomerase
MVTPYERKLTKLVADYIEASGIEVHDALSLEVAGTSRSPRSTPRGCSAIGGAWT